jgi:hypothetical protein
MGFSQSRYYSGAEGAEGLDEDYMEALMAQPGQFFWVLDKQSDGVAKLVMKAIISPVNDRYTESQVRKAIIKGLRGLDVQSTARLKPLLDAYSIKQ